MIREDFATHIISFEKLNYIEVDLMLKKTWMEFEVLWEKACLDKEDYLDIGRHDYHLINSGETLLKKAYLKAMKQLTLKLYEHKAERLRKDTDVL